jgi:uncharacterized protein YnzC (UPF0291/DUF896 family)
MSTTLDNGTNTGVAILSRVLQPEEATFSPDAAQTLLALKFQKADERRMNQLADKARKGTLTEKERAEAEQYNLVVHMLALLQAKARHALDDEKQHS